MVQAVVLDTKLIWINLKTISTLLEYYFNKTPTVYLKRLGMRRPPVMHPTDRIIRILL